MGRALDRKHMKALSNQRNNVDGGGLAGAASNVSRVLTANYIQPSSLFCVTPLANDAEEDPSAVQLFST